MFDLFSICTVIVVISIAVALVSFLLLLIKSRRTRLSILCVFLSVAIIGISILLIFTDVKSEIKRFTLVDILVFCFIFIFFCLISFFPKVLLPVFCVLFIAYYSFSFIHISKHYLLPQSKINVVVSDDKFWVNDIELANFDISKCKLFVVERKIKAGSLLFLKKCYFPVLLSDTENTTTLENVDFSALNKSFDMFYFQTEDLAQVNEINLPMSQFPPYKFLMKITSDYPFLYEIQSLL